MTDLFLRTSADQPAPSGGFLLDWFGRGGPSTVSGSLAEFTRDLGAADPLVRDLLHLGVAVYGADKAVLREEQGDRWSRHLNLNVPVSDVGRWDASASRFEEALAFLTNDRWELGFRPLDAGAGQHALVHPATVVSLFSGGLDSLAGAIDLLERGESVMLVGHYDSNLLLPRQQHLFEQLRQRYGDDRVAYRPFYLRLASASSAQLRPLPSRREPTTRSRSFLFIATAGLMASAVGLDSVTMPENGYIGLNVPLEPSRLGACSTRTTHPHFVRLVQDAFAMVDGPTLSNPLQLKTKAEVLRGCLNGDLLRRLAPASISCAHPEVGRWSGSGYGNCGYCYPCLMRRVALHALSADDPADYRIDVADPAFLSGGGTRAEHLRALMQSAARPTGPGDVLRSGPLPRGQVGEFGALYERGRREIAAWLADVS